MISIATMKLLLPFILTRLTKLCELFEKSQACASSQIYIYISDENSRFKLQNQFKWKRFFIILILLFQTSTLRCDQCNDYYRLNWLWLEPFISSCTRTKHFSDEPMQLMEPKISLFILIDIETNFFCFHSFQLVFRPTSSMCFTNTLHVLILCFVCMRACYVLLKRIHFYGIDLIQYSMYSELCTARSKF